MIYDFQLQFDYFNTQFQLQFNQSNTQFQLQFGQVSVIHDSGIKQYTGQYQIIPQINQQTIQTKDRVLRDNVNIKAIPYYCVSNQFGGNTVIIGGDLNG